MAKIICFLAFCAFIGGAQAQGNSSVQYVYDNQGRLSTVVDPSGSTATYQYDAVGNLLSIARSALPANNALTISTFVPAQGPVGLKVTIFGQGFSTTAASDAGTLPRCENSQGCYQ